MDPSPIPVIVVTGPVGAGKSTVAAAISEILERREIRHAMIDQDYLSWVLPSPVGDRFAARLGFRNLAAIWPNIREVEPRCVILATVVEDREQSLADYREALPGTVVTIVRLDVPIPVILERLEGRESADSIEWFRKRAPELQGIMERGRVEDVLIDVGYRSPAEVAEEVVKRLGVA
jgi:chloramphenicol 3-O-phosphotransferase